MAHIGSASSIGSVRWYCYGFPQGPKRLLPLHCNKKDQPLAISQFRRPTDSPLTTFLRRLWGPKYAGALDFSLDLGAQNTVLYPSFGQSFPAVKAAGLRENHQVTGVGGSANIDSVAIPSLTFTVGGRHVALKPAHILLHDNNSTSNRFAGNLGMDLLNQAHGVEIDFRSMTLSLR